MAAIIIENAGPDDLEVMVAIIADGKVGAPGERVTASNRADYRRAFDAIIGAGGELLVARDDQRGAVLGVIQIDYHRTLADGGAPRMTLHSVFVAPEARGRGIGRLLVAEAEARGRARGVRFVHLTSNKARTDAHRFYRTLGYDQSHEGFKKRLD